METQESLGARPLKQRRAGPPPVRKKTLPHHTNPEGSQGISPSLRDTLAKVINNLGQNLYERDGEVKICLLGALAGEHTLLLGPPGVAKSLLASRLQEYCGEPGDIFSILMTSRTAPNELLGNYSMSDLVKDGLVRREVEGFLPTATIAFFDETFRGSSDVLNILLPILNERKVINGRDRHECKNLLCAIGASNSVPANDDTAMQALLDRFFFRLYVSPVKKDASRLGLLGISTTPEEQPAFRRPEKWRRSVASFQLTRKLQGELRDAVNDWGQFQYPQPLRKCLLTLWDSLEESGKQAVPAGARVEDDELDGEGVSDRRHQKFGNVLRLSAHTNGRTQICISDVYLYSHTAWQQPVEREHVLECIRTSMEPYIEALIANPERKKTAVDTIEKHLWLTEKDKAILLSWIHDHQTTKSTSNGKNEGKWSTRAVAERKAVERKCSKCGKQLQAGSEADCFCPECHVPINRAPVRHHQGQSQHTLPADRKK